jgi:hypothetical protein
MAGRSRRHRLPSPELIGTSPTPLRAPTLLHACVLVTLHLLNSPATKPAAADRRSTHGKRTDAQTLARPDAIACMRRRAKKKARAPSDLNRTAAYRFGRARPGQAGGSGPAWLASAAPARPLFFSELIFSFCKSLQDSKMDRNNSVHSKIVIQISMKSLCCMLTIHTTCVIFRIICSI